MVTVLLDAMHQNPALTVVSMHHEQGAGFAAEGYARTSGRPAVALATSGPGATNLLTAVGSCYFDSIPVLFITGQVNRSEMRPEGRGRQGGFQETDIVAMAKPITKFACLVESADEFPRLLREAIAIATGDRPGPVLLDIPMDIQRTLISDAALNEVHSLPPAVAQADSSGGLDFLGRLVSAVSEAERPLILVGGGLRSSGAVGVFQRLVEAWGVPVVTSLMGLDALPTSSPQHAGFIGSYGNRWANWAVSQADCLVVLGSRLDVRQTGSDVDGFRADRRIFHVDIDESELNNHVSGCEVLHSDLTAFLDLLSTAAVEPAPHHAAWIAAIERQRSMWPDVLENVPDRGINPNLAVRQIAEIWKDVGAFVTDVGQHQMWTAQSIVLSRDQRFLTSGGMGSMGFGLPAAIGALLAEPARAVCLIAGDGGFQCNLQELQTAVRAQGALRIVIFDNGCHGMVRQFQDSYFDGRYYSTKWGYSAPDFCSVATAYGIRSWHVETHGDLESALAAVKALGTEPSLIHVSIDQDLNVYPKMAFGQPYGSMEPTVAPLEMEGT
jgi:acetolactate synthase-1/2/3 large subunit